MMAAEPNMYNRNEHFYCMDVWEKPGSPELASQFGKQHLIKIPFFDSLAFSIQHAKFDSVQCKQAVEQMRRM